MRATSCPPGIASAGLNSVFASYGAVVRGTAEYWASFFEGRRAPLDAVVDLLDYFSEAARRDKPTWATANDVMAEWPIARLRDFSAPDADTEIATLLLPPQAGHDSCIVDFAPGQSQISCARDSGLDRVYSLDWKPGTEQTKDASIEHYLTVIDDVVERLGGRVNLVGDCQGGWLAVIYAALRSGAVASLVIGGAPVDFHAGEPLIHDWLRVLARNGDLGSYRRIVRANAGVLPGEFLLGGFIALQPESELERQIQLLAHIRDPEHVDRFRTFETWFKHTQPIPGAFYLWIVEHLFQKNELVAGTLRVGGERVDLAAITCPLHLIAGATDHITPAAQVYALANYARSAEVEQRLAPGGHLGLFMGHEALREQWTPVFAAVAGRSA